MGAAIYEIAFVLPGGRVVEKKRQGSPAESWLCAQAIQRKAFAVIRYYPSKKGWRILNTRSVQAIPIPTSYGGGGPRNIYKGQVRGQRYWPTKDAAIMVAIQKLSGHNSTG